MFIVSFWELEFRAEAQKDTVLTFVHGHIVWTVEMYRMYERKSSESVHIWDRGALWYIPDVSPVPVCPVKAELASLYMEGGAVAFCGQQGQHRATNRLQDSRVFPDQIQTPDVMPTTKHMKYLSMKTA